MIDGNANEVSAAMPVFPWWAGGLGIGLVLIVAVALVQPIGVSAQYVVLTGVGFAVTGYCPGTALAAAAEGKPDAWMTVAGGLVGALTFAFLVPALEAVLTALGHFGPVTLHGLLGLPGLALAVPLSLVCLWVAVRLPEAGRNL